MTGEDLRFLANRAETVRGRADQRLAEVHARIGSARRRRRAGGVAGASVAVVALVVGSAVLTGPTGANKQDEPIPPADSDTPASNTTRKIVYSDDLVGVPHDAPTPLMRVGTIHVGDREVDIDQTLHTVQRWALKVTDAGAVYAKDDQSMWFTDGGAPRRIAEQACVGTAQSSGFATGNAGPYAVWFDCSPTVEGTDLVVFDTEAGHEVARHSITSCRVPEPVRLGLGYPCVPVDVIGDHVYFTSLDDDVAHDFRFDVTSGQVTSSRPQMYADDLRTHPQALVIGNSWQTGSPTDGTWLTFQMVGSRLVPLVDVNTESVQAEAFDARTGRPVRLRLPSDYQVELPEGFDVPGDPREDLGADTFTVFQWLDDDTVALKRNGSKYANGDIISCHLSDGRCHLAVRSAPADTYRIVPEGGLPG